MRLGSLGPLFRTRAQNAFNSILHRFSKAKEIQEHTVSKKNHDQSSGIRKVLFLSIFFSETMVNSEHYERIKKSKFHVQPIFPHEICMKCCSPMPMPSPTLQLALLMPFKNFAGL
jgi:hypothetical protein